MKKYFIYSVIVLSTLFSCSEDEIKTFDANDNIPSIFFQNVASFNYNSDMTIITKKNFSDSSTISFVGNKISVLSKNARCPIVIAGNVPTKPIKVNFKVNKELSTAVEGVDFNINLDTTYIKTGAVSTSIIIELLRSAQLTKKTLCVAIDLLDSEDYSILERYNDTDVWNDYRKTISGRTFRIFFNEIVTQPFYYQIFGGAYYGPWTAEKYIALNSVMDWSIADWDNAGGAGSKVSLGVMPYAAFQLKNFLQTQADPPINTPLREANGELMQLPGIYAVDYSRYEK